ncbi:MAG: hypothetical protein MSA89_16175 [Clostridium sp.]|nr:hypothetical protein [Clostridium sp.]MDY4183982.1 hypothetical protein [Candidatus Onthovivens sp.]
MVKNEDFFHPVSTDLMTWILDDEPVGRTVTIQTEENTIIGTLGGYLEIGNIIFLQIFNKKMNEMTFVNSKNIMSFTVY